jgi:predicted SAM-dependent methyltransferase
MAVCHRQACGKVRALLARTEPVRLNIGCGAVTRPGWINVDLDGRADLRLDVRRPLPLREASVVEIYCEHLLEHLAFPGEVETVLQDWCRVLAPGGLLSVGVPETADVLQAYVSGDGRYFDWCRAQPWNPSWIETRLDQINFHFRQQGIGFGQDHRYAYDLETLSARLTEAGFVDIRHRPFDPQRDSRPGTLYVDARKP